MANDSALLPNVMERRESCWRVGGAAVKHSSSSCTHRNRDGRRSRIWKPSSDSATPGVITAHPESAVRSFRVIRILYRRFHLHHHIVVQHAEELFSFALRES